MRQILHHKSHFKANTQLRNISVTIEHSFILFKNKLFVKSISNQICKASPDYVTKTINQGRKTTLKKFEIRTKEKKYNQIDVLFQLQIFLKLVTNKNDKQFKQKKNLKVLMAEVGLTTGKKATTSQKLRFLVDEEPKEEKLHSESATHEKVHRLTTKGNMNKFILQFQYVKDTYNEIDKAFRAHVETDKSVQGLKNKMQRSIGVTKIRAVLDYLGYPPTTNEELKDIFGKDVTADSETMTCSAECHYEKRNEEYKNENPTTKQRYEIVTKGFN
ncbi:hypothetical protein RFI_31273, partial [Reticulomyxa filosa]